MWVTKIADLVSRVSEMLDSAVVLDDPDQPQDALLLQSVVGEAQSIETAARRIAEDAKEALCTSQSTQ